VTAEFSPCLQVVVQATMPLSVRIPPSEFVIGDSSTGASGNSLNSRQGTCKSRA